MIKWIISILVLFAIILIGIGKWSQFAGRSADERASSEIVYPLALFLLVIVNVLLVVWAIVRLFF